MGILRRAVGEWLLTDDAGYYTAGFCKASSKLLGPNKVKASMSEPSLSLALKDNVCRYFQIPIPFKIIIMHIHTDSYTCTLPQPPTPNISDMIIYTRNHKYKRSPSTSNNRVILAQFNILLFIISGEGLHTSSGAMGTFQRKHFNSILLQFYSSSKVRDFCMQC